MDDVQDVHLHMFFSVHRLLEGRIGAKSNQKNNHKQKQPKQTKNKQTNNRDVHFHMKVERTEGMERGRERRRCKTTSRKGRSESS